MKNDIYRTKLLDLNQLLRDAEKIDGKHSLQKKKLVYGLIQLLIHCTLISHFDEF